MGPVDLTAVGHAGQLQEKLVAAVVGVLSEIGEGGLGGTSLSPFTFLCGVKKCPFCNVR